MSGTKIKEIAKKSGIGMEDKNGKRIRLGDRVKESWQNKNSDGSDYTMTIKGTVVFGFFSAGEDEWGVKHETLGFFVKYNDDSGTTGITPEWEVITEEEFNKEG